MDIAKSYPASEEALQIKSKRLIILVDFTKKEYSRQSINIISNDIDVLYVACKGEIHQPSL